MSYDTELVGIGVTDQFTVNIHSGDTFTRGTHEGYPVKFTGNREMGHCSADDHFDGIVEAINNDGTLTVVKRGWKKIAYSGTAPTAGRVKLEADGAGGVREDSSDGEEYLVGDVDTTNGTLTIWLG